ncbi:DUF2752 domain-containing protein [Aureliella helgolandensis]|uniref:DUF2752 domain-containing protein n=1 Tax=Aureliella helgolandensis TaxID=2527968 RepID=A0A518G6B0_9BACT|nr:DUF2752 domain-containing protein [Aureliella helgolandensis]QDV24119.1 hypothetical protein Q31a_24320 [Aureliella helgolandensis]
MPHQSPQTEGPPSLRSPRKLPASLRWLCLLVGGGTLGLLILARSLEPAAAGIGTHQQLGLPACLSMVWLNRPCPACGMTTSWALFTRCEFAASASANLGGFLLATIALAFLPVSCYFFLRGRATRGSWFSLALALALASALGAAAMQSWLR